MTLQINVAIITIVMFVTYHAVTATHTCTQYLWTLRTHSRMHARTHTHTSDCHTHTHTHNTGLPDVGDKKMKE